VFMKVLYPLLLVNLLVWGLRREALLAQPQAAKPNIVLIVADDHGTDALGCYGNKAIKTPHLDQLASEGVRFTEAFCTTASCSPSRSVLLTGIYSHANGMYGLQHQEHHFSSLDTIQSLPVLLAKAGYRTSRVGKFHLAPQSVYAFEQVLSTGAANDPATLGRSPVEMALACQKIITDSSDRPFFLYFATDDPHRSNQLLPDGRPTFKTYPAPNPFGNRKQGYPGVHEVVYHPSQVVVPPFLPDLPECRAELAQYYQAVSRLDQGVGRLLQLLKEAGKYENTWIIYLSDNGIAFPGAKTTLYEPGMRVPCIVRSPGASQRGITHSALITLADITPTLLEVAGIHARGRPLHGRSLVPLLEGDQGVEWDTVYASHTLHEVTMYYPMRAIRTRRYKFIYNLAYSLPFPMALDLLESSTWQATLQQKRQVFGKRSVNTFRQRPKWELYDLEQDPQEVNNLADNPRYGFMVEQLKAKLKNFQYQTKDPWIHKWEYE
jgi:N-sulfoglucosamine sulfohydrolase